jgi:hypothetical protein
MPFPIARPVIDGVPSTPADEAGPSHRTGLPSCFDDGASGIDNGRNRDAAEARLRPHRRLDTTARPTAYTPEIAERILDGLADAARCSMSATTRGCRPPGRCRAG